MKRALDASASREAVSVVREVSCHHIRKYSYAYGTSEPKTGDNFFLTFSHCDTTCINIFLKMLSEKYSDDY
jgi:hypothetical protein